MKKKCFLLVVFALLLATLTVVPLSAEETTQQTVWTTIGSASAKNFESGGFKDEGQVQLFKVIPGTDYKIIIKKLMIVPLMDDNPTWQTPDAIAAGKIANLTNIGLSCSASNCSPRMIVYSATDGALTGTIPGFENYALQGNPAYPYWIQEESVEFSWPNMKDRIDCYDSFEIVFTAPTDVKQIGVVFALGDYPAWASAMSVRVESVSIEMTGEHQHDLEDVAEIPADCTLPGKTAGKKCTTCGEIVEGCEEIPARGHTKGELLPEEPASCTKKGVTAGYTCTVCGTVVEGREKLDKVEHNYVEGICSMCGKKDLNYVPTATEAGTETETETIAEAKPGQTGCGSMIETGGLMLAIVSAISALGLKAVPEKKRYRRK